MSDRDDLIDLIDGATWSLIDSDVVADAILAAGWRGRRCGRAGTAAMK